MDHIMQSSIENNSTLIWRIDLFVRQYVNTHSIFSPHTPLHCYIKVQLSESMWLQFAVFNSLHSGAAKQNIKL